MIVKQPVIGIHSEGAIDNLSVGVELSSLSNLESILTYPNAEQSGKTISWNNVKVLSGSENLSALKYAGERKNLDEIIPVLNDVDANTLISNGTKSNFLFYEAQIKFENPIELSYDTDSVRIKNNGKYPVENLIFIADFPSSESPIFSRTYSARIERLAPGEEKEIPLSESVPNYDVFKDDLKKLGFTDKEADSFVNLWGPQLFSPSYRKSSAQFIFRIPESVYDEILPLNAEPKPVDVNRAMYVVLDATSNLFPEKSVYEKYISVLPEDAQNLLMNDKAQWEIQLDPDYKPFQAICEACGWICSATPTPYEFVVSGEKGNLEIRIRDVQCFGQVPIFYYNGVEYRPQLPIPELKGK
ncbi:MAG: hypothetical protein NTZ02_02520 [Candidatus Woesearchaeota archaeon]|nr:hypothetical protein [Candidatus Woesearchaeota archaeon]